VLRSWENETAGLKLVLDKEGVGEHSFVHVVQLYLGKNVCIKSHVKNCVKKSCVGIES